MMIFRSFFYALAIAVICNSQAQTTNYYFGNLHSHSGYSDGNQDSSSSGCSKPSQDYAYAKLSQHFDFLGISEHNHYSNGNPGMKVSSYSPGLAQAAAATTNTFLALYGMEWGVSSSTNGHVVIYGFNQLIGWETNNYNIYNDEYDYDGLFRLVKNNPASFCYLAHPYTTDFKNLALNPYVGAYDTAIVGVPFRSGIYNSTNTSYSDYPAGDYFSYYLRILAAGYHVGMGYDHDNHKTTFGRSTGGRLVIMAPALTSSDLFASMKKRHFYGSDDWNTHITLNIGGAMMGDTISDVVAPAISVTHNDMDGEQASTIRIYSGVYGSTVQATILTYSNSLNTLSFTDNSITQGMTKYYFTEIIQADGDRIVSSPIWFTMRGTIGIKEYAKENNFIAFPNPAVNQVNLSTGLNEVYSVEIRDYTGRVVFSKSYSLPDVSIPVNGLASGFYSIRVKAANSSAVKTLVIE